MAREISEKIPANFIDFRIKLNAQTFLLCINKSFFFFFLLNFQILSVAPLPLV